MGNYYRQQIARLGGDADSYALKIQARNDDGDGPATKWLGLNTDQLRRITEILAEGDDDSPRWRAYYDGVDPEGRQRWIVVNDQDKPEVDSSGRALNYQDETQAWAKAAELNGITG